MEELNADELQQLEEQLYAQVHHAFDESSNNFETKNLENAATSKFQTKRYWCSNNALSSESSLLSNSNSVSKSKDFTPPRTQPPPPPSAPTTTKNTKQNNIRNRIQNPFANKPNAKHKHKMTNHSNNQQSNIQKMVKQNQRIGGPFAEKMEKMQRVSQFHAKKLKASNAHAKALAKPQVVATITLDEDEDDDDDDEVVIVPLPPVPVVSIESDSDENSTQQVPVKTKNDTQLAGTPTTNKPDALAENTSRCVSPASVMSHDDFIAQGDRHRLLVVNNNADSFLEAPNVSPSTQTSNVGSRRNSADDIECIGTFIMPRAMTSKAAGQQDYRVGSTEYRAMDVYESESDIVSDGVYSKGSNKKQTVDCIVGNNSDDDDEADDDVADISENPKNRRLRKRRASTSIRSSESNGGANSSDSENDGVASTGVPYIYRGPALDNHKTKMKRRRRQSTLSNGRMSDTEFVATLNSLAQGGESNNDRTEQANASDDDDDTDENMPTARDIAEIVLNSSSTVIQQHQEQQQLSDEIIELPSTPPDDEAVPPQFVDEVEKIMSKVNAYKEQQLQALYNAPSDEDDDVETPTTSNILSTSDITPFTTAVKDEMNANDSLTDDKTAHDEDDDSNKIKYFTGFSSSNKNCLSDGCGWNEEMRRFYNKSWGGENFKKDFIFKSMNRNPNLWRISNLDRFPAMTNRSKREKCMNCLSFGHSRAKCPKPKRALTCYMCGESGHTEARCPNTRCLQCGSERMAFVSCCRKCMHWNKRICPICKLRGHSLNYCPDKWRRYHSTTKANQNLNSRVNYNRNRYCCYCGMRGHLSEECRKAFNRTEYPMIASEIKSHQKSYYDEITSPNRAPGIKCQLLYDPTLTVKFAMAEKATRSQLYGRFLNAVGLGKIIGVKRKTEDRKVINPLAATITGSDFKKMPPPSPQLPTKSSPSTVTQETAKRSPLTSNMAPPPPVPVLPISAECDSDSNYSFSDHFEVSSTTSPSTTTAAEEQVVSPEGESTNINTITEPLPDFIPLGGGNRYQEDALDVNGITAVSARFVEANTDDEDVDEQTVSAADSVQAVEPAKPCKAKIFISNEHYRYFQSNEGQVYLCKVLPEHELTGSLEKTTAGYAIFLTGLPQNQDKMQLALLKKYEELNNARVNHQVDNQLPKNVKTLIRFLRDNINQLYTNLGSATDLYKRLNDIEKLQTKSSQQAADRIRRTLNKIFLGQAGLHNGDAHFDLVLKSLRKLLSNEFSGVEKTPEALRKEIYDSWRMLFSPYNHKSYDSLLAAYIQMPAVKRNRMQALKIEANILRDRSLDVSLSKEQKQRLNNTTKNEKNQMELVAKETSAGQEPKSLSNTTIPSTDNAAATSNKNELANATPAITEQLQLVQNDSSRKLNDNENRNNNSAITTANDNTTTIDPNNDDIIDSLSETLLTHIEESFTTKQSGPRVGASDTTSKVWSDKAQAILSPIIALARSTNSKSLDRLERIYTKAANGKLSYVNFCDLVKIQKRTITK